MTEAQKRVLELQGRQAEIRSRLGEISMLDNEGTTPEIRTEATTLRTELTNCATREAAAISAVSTEDLVHVQDAGVDAETRERIELRGKASLASYLKRRAQGLGVNGAEAEYSAAFGVEEGHIPMDLWEPETRAITAAPGTVGLNLSLVPEVFAPSVASTLGISMPQVPSGTYTTARVSAGADAADAVAKSAELPEIASTWTVESATPKRIGTVLRLTLEDIAAVGAAEFEPMLRSHISMVLSDELDDQLLNGAGTSDDLNGMFKRLTNPSTPAAAVETWTRFLAIQSGVIDGLWATELGHVSMLVGVDSYRLAAATFQGTDSEESAASYLARQGASFRTNSRMPAKVSHVQQGIAHLMGRTGMETAVAPTWGSVVIDDVYTGASKGERRYVLSALVGDVIIRQPGAYKQVAFRVSA